MPVNEKQSSGEVLYQRQQYQIQGLSHWYWDYKDDCILSLFFALYQLNRETEMNLTRAANHS